MTYKIGYIDNDKDAIKDFKSTFHEEFNIVDMELTDEINTLIEEIASEGLDAVVIDYLFADTMTNIQYDGADVLREIISTFQDFPVVIFTAYEEVAEDKTDNPYLVYVKEEIILEGKKDDFIRKLKCSIGKYKKKIQESKKELLVLLKKIDSEEELSLGEEEKVVELDDFLEKSIYKHKSLPKELKKIHLSEKIDDLIETTKSLISKVKKHAS